MVAVAETFRRTFASRLDRALSVDGFVRSGRVFLRTDVTGNAIALDLQSYAVPGDCAGLFINVAILLGIEIEVRRRHALTPTWRPTTSIGVWQERLGPDGWEGNYVWKLCSLDDVDREARRACDSFHAKFGGLKELMDTDVMLATAKTERWQRRRVLEGYVLAARGRLDEVMEFLEINDKDYADLLQFERYILEVARMNAGDRFS